MATAKFTIKREGRAIKDVVVSAGAAEAQTDTISVNIDRTSMTKLEAFTLLGKIGASIFAGKWFPN